MRKARPTPLPLESTQRLFRSTFPLAEMESFRTDAWAQGVANSEDELKPIFPTVLHALVNASQAKANSGITLVDENDPTVEHHETFASILQQARHVAGRLAHLGLRPQETVLVVLPTGFEFVIVYFALQLVGAVPVPAYPPAVLERAQPAIDRLRQIGRHAHTCMLITNNPLKKLLGQVAAAIPGLRATYSAESLLKAGGTARYLATPQETDLAFIQYTSGSTGSPKGVALTHKNLVSNIHAIGQISHVGRRDVSVSWLPLYHDMGIIGGLLFPIYWRLPLVLLSPMTFLMQPETWLWAMSKHRGTVSCAPNFAYGRCVKRVRPGDVQGLDLSSWRLSLNGAEPVNLRTVRDFQERFAPFGFRSTTMLPVYGLAEVSVAAAFPEPETEVEYEVVDRQKLADGQVAAATGPGSMALVSVGRAIPGHALRIVDAQGRSMSERQVGHIVIRGPSVMQGYYRDPEATAAVLRDGWLWTGDLGFLSNGRLFITGRVKDLIICKGKNYYAEDLERVAERIDGVRPGSVVAFAIYDDTEAEDKVIIACETRLQRPDVCDALKHTIMRRVQDDCGVMLHEVVLLPPGCIPKTPSGKRQRSLTRELYQKNALHRPRTSTLSVAWILARSFYGHARTRMRQFMHTTDKR